jgi:DNA adenine methylase Dam
VKNLKTCLRYPGGKSRATNKMDPYFPDLSNYQEYRESFLGGGSVAIYVTKKYPDLKIWVNDLYEPLFNFWVQLQSNGEKLQELLVERKKKYNNPELAKKLFLQSKDIINLSEDNFYRAAAFYVVNKCSFSGLTESSSFSAQASVSNFSLNGIEKLSAYSKLIKNWKITNQSYESLLDKSSNIFLYLDPPYDIKDSLYGKKGSMHKGFDHDEFAKNCESSGNHMLISYNSDQLVKNRFLNWNTAEYDLTYTMRSVGDYMKEQKQRKELLIFNYGIEGLAKFY